MSCPTGYLVEAADVALVCICPRGWPPFKGNSSGVTSSPLCDCCVGLLWPCKQHKPPRTASTGDPAAPPGGPDLGGLHIQATDVHKQVQSRSRRHRRHKRQRQTGLQCP